MAGRFLWRKRQFRPRAAGRTSAPQTFAHPKETSVLDTTTALILAGGLGTRLRSVVADLPKVLARVHGKPFLARILDQLADAGIRRVVLCTGYRGELIEAEFGQCYRGLALEYSRESQPRGTGGALALALPKARSPTVLALNGDSYCDADLGAFGRWHLTTGFAGSLLLTEVADTSRYGRVDVTPEGRILDFREKSATKGRGTINGGIYLLSADLLAGIEPDSTVSLERDLLPGWVAAGLGGYVSRGAFLDIGTPESFRDAERFFPADERDAAPRRASAPGEP
jgi:NDP-sugar pyrophosphorylase family protein